MGLELSLGVLISTRSLKNLILWGINPVGLSQTRWEAQELLHPEVHTDFPHFSAPETALCRDGRWVTTLTDAT